MGSFKASQSNILIYYYKENYDVVMTGETISPVIKLDASNSITGYEIVSGEDYVSLNEETGEVTGIAKGKAVIKVTAKRTNGAIITAVADVHCNPTVFAIYSSTDGSLTFYNRTIDEVKVGGAYNNKVVTNVYTEFDTAIYTSAASIPWYSVRSNIKSVEFVDEISPVSTADWFYEMSNCTNMDLAKLDTSNVTDMQSMFYKCSALTELDVSNFDTSKLTNMSWMFAGCSSSTELDLSSFDTISVTDMDTILWLQWLNRTRCKQF